MPNNAELGLSIQKLICEKYGIVPHSYAIAQFEASYNPAYKTVALDVIERIFTELKLDPTVCLTYAPSPIPGEKFFPHNFYLSNGATLSIRTNLKGDKIAPRVVGQAGIETFNEHFSDIAGYTIESKNQIKQMVYDNIHLMLPVFIEYFFLSDYTVWMHMQNG